jgi:hypothetical protein
MKVNDLIRRKKPLSPHHSDEEKNGIFGIVIALGHGGNPRHPTASVLYPPTGNQYEIARSLLEVINESC